MRKQHVRRWRWRFLDKRNFEAADMSGAPSIKDAKPAKKTNVKYDPHMKVMAPQKEEVEQIDEADSLAAMQARREKRLAAQRKEIFGNFLNWSRLWS